MIRAERIRHDITSLGAFAKLDTVQVAWPHASSSLRCRRRLEKHQLAVALLAEAGRRGGDRRQESATTTKNRDVAMRPGERKLGVDMCWRLMREHAEYLDAN